MIFNEQLPSLMGVHQVLIYLRKSRADRDDETVEEVLSKHEESIQKNAVRIFGMKIPEENIFREVVSGETIQARPEMMKVLNTISSENIKAVMVYDVQRLSRGDWEDGGKILTAFKYSNTLVITPNKIFDLNEKSGYDYKMFKAELSAGYDYLEYTKTILHSGIVRSVEKGNYLGSVAPYGYKRVTVDKSPTLEIDESEADGVRMMFELYASGIGVYKVVSRLNDSPYKARNNKKWSDSTVRRILQSPIYIGKIRWNYRKEKKIYEDGEIKKIRPLGTEDEVFIVDGKHQPIIDEELWNKVQNIFGSHTKEKSNTELRNALAGLLKCKCGSSMVLRTYIGKRKPRLVCKAQRYCNTTSNNYDIVYDRVIQSLETYVKDFEFKLKNQDKSLIDIHQRMIDDLESELEKLYKKEDEIFDFLEDGIYTKDIYLKRKAKNDEKIDEVKDKIKRAKMDAPKKINYEDKIIKFNNVIRTLKDDNIKPKDKNDLLKEIIDKIIYDREKTDNSFDMSNFTLDIYLKE